MKIKNTKSGVVHATVEEFNNEITHCGIPALTIKSTKYPDSNMVWNLYSDVTCKNCCRIIGLRPLPSPARSSKGFKSKGRKTMKASEAISRLVQLIVAHGDREIVLEDKHSTVAGIFQDNTKEGEASEAKVFVVAQD